MPDDQPQEPLEEKRDSELVSPAAILKRQHIQTLQKGFALIDEMLETGAFLKIECRKRKMKDER